MEVLFSQTLNPSSLRVFGCACYPNLRPYHCHKLDFHSDCCVYLGPSHDHKGYRCLLPSGQIIVSRQVIFNEDFFSF